MDFKETKAILIKFAKEVVKNSKKELRSKRASGKLEGSIGYDLNVMPNSFSLEFFMLDYGKFIDAGVDGKRKKYQRKYPVQQYRYTNKMPPPSALDSWVVKRGLAPRGDKGQFKGRSISSVGFQKSITYLIARHIFFNGLKPTYFFTKSFTNAFDKLPPQFIDKYALDVDEFFDLTFDT